MVVSGGRRIFKKKTAIRSSSLSRSVSERSTPRSLSGAPGETVDRLFPQPGGCECLTSIHVALYFFFSSRRRHTSYWLDWSSDVCSSDLVSAANAAERNVHVDPECPVGGACFRSGY